MNIWISDNTTKNSRIVSLHCEKHSNCNYIGDLNDEELKALFLELKDDIDVVKNIKLLKYYGYLHLFIKN